MITTKIEGLDKLAKRFEQIGREAEKLNGSRMALRCPQCGSTELLANSDLGEDAPVTCKPHGHTLGRKRDLRELVTRQAREHLGAEMRRTLK